MIVAIDSFKGCLSSAEANAAAAAGVISCCPDADVRQVVVSDGGEGFLEAFQAALGGEMVELTVCDPLMRPITAHYLLCEGQLAVIEMAQASGLTLLKPEERNPLKTTTYGTGQLVVDAVQRGVQHIIVGLGGSATSDAGVGMIYALQDAFGKDIRWEDIEALKHVRFTIATDVKNPLYGENGAAHVFGPQKGATPEMVAELDRKAKAFAQYSAIYFDADHSEDEGAGAAGGLGYAFLQYLHADCQPGIDLLLKAIRFDELTRDADLILTGEGAADRQTLMGKLPAGILQHAGDIPVCLLAGRVSDKEALLRAGFSRVECINPPDITLQEAMRPEVAQRHIQETVARVMG